MADGLKKFTVENSVENQDILLFQHWGHMSFVLRKLDVTRTEKAHNPALTPSAVGRPLGNGPCLADMNDNIGENVVGEKKRRGRPRKANAPVIDGSTSRISGKNQVHENESVNVIVPSKKAKHMLPSVPLIIPSEFFEKHMPIAKTTIVLRNSIQKMWTVSIIPLGSYHAFSNGFQAFVEQNNLKSGDTCVFELVESNLMQVHFFYDYPKMLLSCW
ncbi:uncharacterized protein LOC124941535 [Impatiens glandulifera]|uniref:uncharacterized protein LOC124941535 n=1 Tax=Impatiens glandulifera TaxID=253017 RepID=UPI001FB09B61|nr:uncharacterized protein LOC124941535 [Impatiens glandulifera]